MPVGQRSIAAIAINSYCGGHKTKNLSSKICYAYTHAIDKQKLVRKFACLHIEYCMQLRPMVGPVFQEG